MRFIPWVQLIESITEIGPDKKKNPIGIFLFDEFINYIERHFHMTPFTGINFRDGYDSDLEISEGFFNIEFRGKIAKIPYPKQAGSWYHWSKVHERLGQSTLELGNHCRRRRPCDACARHRLRSRLSARPGKFDRYTLLPRSVSGPSCT